MLRIHKENIRETDLVIVKQTNELKNKRNRLQKFSSYKNENEDKYKRPRRLRLRKIASYNNKNEDRSNHEVDLAFLAQDREQLNQLENLKEEIMALKTRHLTMRHYDLYRNEDEVTKIKVDNTIGEDERDDGHKETREKEEVKVDPVCTKDPDHNWTDEPFTDDQILCLCQMLNCAKEDIFNLDYCESALKLILQNIETMQSIILAQTAALKGRDEFNGKLPSYDIKNDYSFAPIHELPKEKQVDNFSSRFRKFSKRAGQKVKKFRIGARKVDTYRKNR